MLLVDRLSIREKRLTPRAPDRLRRMYAGPLCKVSCYYDFVVLLTPAAGTPYGKTTLRGRKQTQIVRQQMLNSNRELV
jgi:hypothetical protein